MTWSPVSLGLCLGGTTEEVQNLLVRMYMKVTMGYDAIN